MSFLPCIVPILVAEYWDPYMKPFVMPLTQLTLAGSCYTTVALTVERYISGKMPSIRISCAHALCNETGWNKNIFYIF